MCWMLLVLSMDISFDSQNNSLGSFFIVIILQMRKLRELK